MAFEKIDIFGNPNIGVYVFTNERFSLIPRDAPEKFENTVSNILQIPIYRITIGLSPLIGVFISGNSNGIVISKLVSDEEIRLFKKILEDDINILIADNVKVSAIGNLILANDKAAIISPMIASKIHSLIQEILDVEIMVKTIAGSPLVGSVAVVTNKGLLLSPLAEEDEIEELSDFFGVKADVGTVNRGNIFLSSGIVVNSKGGIVGSETTGPELMRLHQVFFG